MAAPGTTGSYSTSSRVIRSFVAQPLDVIRSIRSSYSSNNVYVSVIEDNKARIAIFGDKHDVLRI